MTHPAGTLRAGPVRFDDARPRALAIAGEVAAEGQDVLLVRDVLGRFSLVVDDRGRPVPEDRPAVWATRLADRLQRYAAERPVLLASALFSAEALLHSPHAVPVAVPVQLPAEPPAAGRGTVRLIDNTVVGQDWSRVSTPDPETDGSFTHRTALYGFRGGVGRTTATAMLARHLADEGRIVLVVDLDLEAPGAGPLLADQAHLPPYGIVDQLVEAAVGNAQGLEVVAPTGYTPPTGRGELWVAPARGRDGDGPDGGAEEVPYSYVDKLNRVYADIPGAAFADRLEDAVRCCEDAVRRTGDSGRRPDVVLMDSRAGIHDIAAVTISRLCDLALLFGADNRQTWQGYGDLFAAWRTSGQAREIREKLRMVAAMVPDSPQRPKDAYLESFRDHAWECFSALYDDVSDPDDPDAFFPTPQDDSAPHYPVPILFEPGLIGLDADSTPGWQDRAFVQAAYRDFLTTAGRLITANPASESPPES
ncbi:KGGVGR-motif variant AAA ATPase [Streptomyces sp. YIM 98790]|uniref:KGGVGR-motif variant AAA ATPase n=1 Tax=Streptomyces sp. YIM 98790 TaxID=2689077 RepID=UPI00140C7D8F|nr:AAA family ATPase [Streptomyces sp. YIM 98790]